MQHQLRTDFFPKDTTPATQLRSGRSHTRLLTRFRVTVACFQLHTHVHKNLFAPKSGKWHHFEPCAPGNGSSSSSGIVSIQCPLDSCLLPASLFFESLVAQREPSETEPVAEPQ